MYFVQNVFLHQILHGAWVAKFEHAWKLQRTQNIDHWCIYMYMYPQPGPSFMDQVHVPPIFTTPYKKTAVMLHWSLKYPCGFTRAFFRVNHGHSPNLKGFMTRTIEISWQSLTHFVSPSSEWCSPVSLDVCSNTEAGNSSHFCF